MGFKCLLEVMVLKINFNYINKKIIAGLLAGTMTLSLAGCGYDDKYEVNENGEVELVDTYSYDEVRNFYFLELKTNTGTSSYLARHGDSHINRIYDVYTNVYLGTIDYDNNTFVEPENLEIINLEKLDSYLIGFNFIKSSYNKDDLDYLHQQIKENERLEKTLKK